MKGRGQDVPRVDGDSSTISSGAAAEKGPKARLRDLSVKTLACKASPIMAIAGTFHGLDTARAEQDHDRMPAAACTQMV